MLGVSDEHDARVIASYMQAGQLHAQHEQEASGTGDKGRICGRGLFDCFLAIPDNVGWWGLHWTAAQMIKWKKGNCKEDGGCSLHSVIVKRLSWVIRQHSVIVKRLSWVKSESTQTSGILCCTNSESESWGAALAKTSRRLHFQKAHF